MTKLTVAATLSVLAMGATALLTTPDDAGPNHAAERGEAFAATEFVRTLELGMHGDRAGRPVLHAAPHPARPTASS